MILIIVLIIILIIYVIEYNLVKTLHNKVLQSKSGIDVILNKRFDLIPNLVECVKEYEKYEQQVLQDIMKERQEYYNTKSLIKGNEVNNKCNSILALSEDYPILKSNEQFLNLEKSLEKIENQLQASRRLYNSDVTMYNTKISTFPGNIFALFMHMEREELFEYEEKDKEVK